MPELTTSAHDVPLPAGPIHLRWAAATDTGRRREVNQDAVLARYPLFVVADGMGGHIGGEIASASTVTRLGDLVDHGSVTPKGIEKALGRAVKDIASHPETTDEGTGTTVTGVYLDTAVRDPHWVTLNIGDSRVYLLRAGTLVQITTDHSVVQELVAAGRLSPEEAEQHPYGNVITRAVGPTDSVRPDYVRLDIVDGDRFVVCSDGLTKELTDFGIQHFLREHADPADAVSAMLEAALENGGRDNVTIIVVDVSAPGYGHDDDVDRDDADDDAPTNPVPVVGP
ncbi:MULTISPECIES: PP2C family protein-serine/threonine phosphatase [Microbacterium]|uniref:PP2C family protein-serine/threonine phosphatase n=1 Tax=Microbacterium TaxID=33882 RepID=UPI0006FAE7A0|nr:MULTISPECIES: protein phosphatase 2C domain-containing protein [unclassified Microbacterium]MBN9198887.1 serine/threonine-protein phosphatase [Microbacterium ginsengisoli]MCK9917590.1 protein phosphatase 2C domain-containing protein [Microbacteriaceae bacterium K1510]KQR92333.1 protein phosphatase [Microbacterium sp. Leaf351]KQR92868.1 protein phosphatase [Microbacterium sp. Leaf347]ODU76489.1 MAG: protein phosphatase [Microbacterium sp. SCN 71-21]